MKEKQNEPIDRCQPSDAEMNDMYRHAWLDFHADAQKAKQDLSRRYAKMVDTFGSYKNMPDGVKQLLKDDYAGHEAKWGENGEEMQERFGVGKSDPNAKPTEDQQKKKQEFLQQLHQQRQQGRSVELER